MCARNIHIPGRDVCAYQIGWFLTYNEWPPRFIDHIDGDRSNNKLCNLRSVTQAQNTYNQRKSKAETTSRYKGVSAVGKKWRANIDFDHKRIHIGYYPTEEEAARAYDTKAKELHGEHACLNFGVGNALYSLEDSHKPVSERYFLASL